MRRELNCDASTKVSTKKEEKRPEEGLSRMEALNGKPTNHQVGRHENTAAPPHRVANGVAEHYIQLAAER